MINKKFLYLFIIMIILLLFGCGCDKKVEKMPKIIFMQENYFSGKNSYGTFVDNKGNIYSFDLRNKAWMDDKEKYQRLIKEYLGKSKKYKIIGHVNQDNLKKIYAQVKKASLSKRKLVITESRCDAVYGYHEWTAFRYDFIGRIRSITLYCWGDYKIVNKDIHIKKVVASVRKMIPEDLNFR